MVRFSNPLNDEDMRITSDFLDPNRTNHTGIDFGNHSDGHPIYAAADGKVIYSDISGGFGNTIVIEHEDGTSTLYGHMKYLSDYKVGDYVNQGDTIGFVGNTGKGTASHLHYEWINKEGTQSIKKYSGNGKLGLKPHTNRLNPHSILNNKTGYFIWRSEKGPNTCEECSSRDGKIFKYGEDREPPLHPHCECYAEDLDNPYNYEYMFASRNFEKELFELKNLLRNKE